MLPELLHILRAHQLLGGPDEALLLAEAVDYLRKKENLPPSEWGPYLTPLLAKSPEQAEQLAEIIPQWAAQLRPPEPPELPEPLKQPEQTEAPKARSFGQFWKRLSKPKPPALHKPAPELPEPAPPVPSDLARGPYTFSLPTAPPDALLANPLLKHALLGLAQRAEMPRARLHLPRSVRATVRRGGYPFWVEQPLRKPVAYLFLVEEKHPDDHQARFFAALASGLQSLGVPCVLCFFHGGLQTVHLPGPQANRHLPAHALSRRYPEYRLVLCCSPQALIDDGQCEPALREVLLPYWPEAVLLCPPAQAMSPEARFLEKSGLRICPATEAGIGALGTHAAGNPEEEQPMPELPPQLLSALCLPERLYWPLSLRLVGSLAPAPLRTAQWMALCAHSGMRNGRLPEKLRQKHLQTLDPHARQLTLHTYSELLGHAQLDKTEGYANHLLAALRQTLNELCAGPLEAKIPPRQLLDLPSEDCGALLHLWEKQGGHVPFEDMPRALRRWRLIPLPEMCYIRGGTFEMGSNEYDDEKPIHLVRVPDFYLAYTLVTIEQYLAFCNETHQHWPEWMEAEEYHYQTGSDDHYKKHQLSPEKRDHPVVGVSWHDAVVYCSWLSEKTGKHYRLPTEAEWEYAARGGAQSSGYTYAGSNNLDEVGWYDGNSKGSIHPVAQKKPNELGLYDMSGNVWEWCEDWYASDYYTNSPKDNPRNHNKGPYRVFRGGSWYYSQQFCRVATRTCYAPGYRFNSFGFRLASQ